MPLVYAPTGGYPVAVLKNAQALQSVVEDKFAGLTPPAPGHSANLLVHCDSTICVRTGNGSRLSPDMNRLAIDFMTDCITKHPSFVSRDDIGWITPHAANKENLDHYEQKARYSEASLAPRWARTRAAKTTSSSPSCHRHSIQVLASWVTRVDFVY